MAQGAVIVTGASRGLGAAAVRELARLGVPTVIGARTPADLQAVANDVRTLGGRVTVVVGDITQDKIRAGLIRAAQVTYGGLLGLINNAAMLTPIALLSQAEEAAWAAHWQLNVLAPVLLTKMALPALRQSRGRVINVSSGAAERVTPGWGAYDLSKAAINQFTRQLAAEEPDVISVAFRPGVVDTEMQAEIRSSGQGAMLPQSLARFVRLFEDGQLLPPEKPGQVLAKLALWAPSSLSGQFVSWDDAGMEHLAPGAT